MCQLPSSPLKARVFLLIAAASKTKQTRNCNSLEGLISARVMLCSAKWINHWYSHTSISYRRKKKLQEKCKSMANTALHSSISYRLSFPCHAALQSPGRNVPAHALHYWSCSHGSRVLGKSWKWPPWSKGFFSPSSHLLKKRPWRAMSEVPVKFWKKGWDAMWIPDPAMK